MKTKPVYFIRHGQTIWNVENKICGASDIALTKEGHAQAIQTGKMICEKKIKADLILYSPLIRARDTALHISEVTGIPAKEEIRLIEQNFGKYESTPRNGEEFREAKKEFLNRYEGGESMFHLGQRIYNLLDELKESDKTCILVAHNGIARVIESYFHEMTNEEYASFGVENGSIHRFEWVLDEAETEGAENEGAEDDSDVESDADAKEYHFWGWNHSDANVLDHSYDQVRSPKHLYDLLSQIWCADTCAPRMRDSWSPENKTLGQCSITAFLAQDIFGGKVYGVPRSGGNYHCYNVIGDARFDLTSEQFGDEKLCYENNPEQFKEDHMAKQEKKERYEYLKEKLREKLAIK